MSPEPRPYGKLPDLLEEVEFLVGKRRVEAFLTQEIQNLQQLRDKMMDDGPSMEIYDAALDIQGILDRVKGRRGRLAARSSAMCIAVIKSWRVLHEVDPTKKMALLLIDLVDADVVTKLGLVGEFA